MTNFFKYLTASVLSISILIIGGISQGAPTGTTLRGGSGILGVQTADVLDAPNISLGFYWDKYQYVLPVDPKDTFYGFAVTAGIMNNLEIFGTIPYMVFEGPEDTNEQGISDTRLGLKYRFLNEAGSRPAMAIYTDVNLTTGDEEKFLGSGRNDVRAGLVASKDLGPTTASAQAGWRFMSGRDDLLDYGVGFMFPDDKALKFFMEFLGTADLYGHGLDTGQVTGGLRYDMGDRWQVTAGGGYGLYGKGPGAPDWRVYAGLNFYTGGIPGVIPPEPPPPVEPPPPPEPPPPVEPPPPPPPPVEPPPPPPVEPPPPPPTPKPAVKNIYFEFDHFLLTPGDEAKLKKVAEYLKADKKARVSVAGHCDSVGTASYNEGLGLRRAKSISYFLIFDLGIHPDRIEYDTKGEMEPAESNKTDEGRAANRRGHLVILD